MSEAPEVARGRCRCGTRGRADLCREVMFDERISHRRQGVRRPQPLRGPEEHPRRQGPPPALPGLLPLEVMECDLGTAAGELDAMCAKADFVFNLAGVNRPEDPAEFMAGNYGFASDLLAALERRGNACPVMLASSAQASLEAATRARPTASPSWPASASSASTRGARARACSSTGSPTSTASGAARATTPPSRPSVTPSPTAASTR